MLGAQLEGQFLSTFLTDFFLEKCLVTFLTLTLTVLGSALFDDLTYSYRFYSRAAACLTLLQVFFFFFSDFCFLAMVFQFSSRFEVYTWGPLIPGDPSYLGTPCTWGPLIHGDPSYMGTPHTCQSPCKLEYLIDIGYF